MSGMSQETRSLLVLILGCTFAAALFGFGANVLSFRSAYEESGRELFILLARILVYVVLAIILVFKGGWRGLAGALFMVAGATTVEWWLLPAAYSWAALSDPAGYRETLGTVERPDYVMWALFDVLAVGIAAAATQGLRVILINFGPEAHHHYRQD